jgi:hypothetical protein
MCVGICARGCRKRRHSRVHGGAEKKWRRALRGVQASSWWWGRAWGGRRGARRGWARKSGARRRLNPARCAGFKHRRGGGVGRGVGGEAPGAGGRENLARVEGARSPQGVKQGRRELRRSRGETAPRAGGKIAGAGRRGEVSLCLGIVSSKSPSRREKVPVRECCVKIGVTRAGKGKSARAPPRGKLADSAKEGASGAGSGGRKIGRGALQEKQERPSLAVAASVSLRGEENRVEVRWSIERRRSGAA